jgi:hypothetical protein
MLFYDISIFLKPMQWFEAAWIGKISKTGWWSLHTGSELTVNHQSVFFLHFFGWQWGYPKVKMARESSLKEGPTDFPHVISVTRWIHQGLRAPRWGESDKWFSKPLDIISS